MLTKETFLKRKYFLITGLLLLVIITAGVLEPVILENISKSWPEKITPLNDKIKKEVRSAYSGIESALRENASELGESLAAKGKYDFEEIASTQRWSAYSILIVNEKNGIEFISNFNIKPDSSFFNRKEGALYYFSSPLFDYLSVSKSFTSGGRKFKLFLLEPVEKKYSLNTPFFKVISLREEFSRKFQVQMEIITGGERVDQRDGRRQAVEIFNSAGDRIATVIFDNASQAVELNKARELTAIIQIVSLFLIILLLLRKLKTYLDRIKSRPVKDLLVILIIVFVRILFFIFEVPARFLNGPLTDASYFSSTLGFGIVKSPLDLFLTVAAILCIALLFYDAVRSCELQNIKKKRWAVIMLFPSLIFVYFLFLRALGASIRSVIYDSTLKYFRDPFIIPDLPLFAMHLNVLLIGLSAFLISAGILLFLFKLINGLERKGAVIFFAALQVLAFVYDISQPDPQGNDFTRIMHILFTFSAAWWVFRKKSRNIFEYSIYLVLASFISILLLNYYNKNIEKNSLPATAQEFLRGNEKLNEFMAIQAAVQFAKEPELIEGFERREQDFNPLAFKLWSRSILPSEILSAHLSILDFGYKEMGHFDYNFETHRIIDWQGEKGDEYKIKNVVSPFTGKRMFFVLAPVKKEEKIIGYIELALHPLNDYFGRRQCFNILSSNNQRLNSTVDFSQLKVFKASNGEILSSTGEIPFNSREIKELESNLAGSAEEAFIEKKIDGKTHLIYLKKDPSADVNEFVGIALRRRDFTQDLFDFFKVFFIHSLIILVFTILAFISEIKSLWRSIFNFRARLLYSLIIISIVPLLLSAVYFKSLVEEKNIDDINYKLNKRAAQIVRYLGNYTASSSLLDREIFEKIKRDIGVEYSVFSEGELAFTTLPGFYTSTLLPGMLNSKVKYELVEREGKQILISENIDGYEFKSLYVRAAIPGREYIININNAFNEISLSLSNLEVDVFLFGTYSFAAVLIILLSSFLAGQISKPIRELTRATSAVAEGDLDVKVTYKDKGEMNNLIVGFNEMVEKLKRSQLELAEFEREAAWKEMARQVAHEIKNPLTPMKLSIQQLIAAYNDKSPKFNGIFEKVTSTIISQIETLNKIASEFSGFARMPKMKIERIDLKKICAEAVNLFDSEYKIKISAPGGSVEVMADADHLKRSFINLIRNSIQASASAVEIIIDEKETEAVIRFIDNGHGIPAENVGRIFEENFTTKAKGMGLGLSMARKYFELLNGTISVGNTSSSGTEFIITIPKAGLQ